MRATPTLQSLAAAVARLRGGHHHDYRAYADLLQQCAGHRHFFLAGAALHARIVLLSISPDNFLASKLISFFSRHGHLAEARRVFDDIPHKNLFSFNAMIIAYALHYQPSHCLRLFSLLSTSPDLKPDAYSISALLKLLSDCAGYSSFSFWREIHGYVFRHWLETDLFVANGLVTLYSRFGYVCSARRVFDSMPERDIVSWNSMISGYSQGGFHEECLRLYREMECDRDGVTPNNVSVVSVLHSCSQLKDIAFGTEIHRSIAQKGIVADTAVWNSVIGLYSKCGHVDYARQLFEEMPAKDKVTFGAMISGYMSHGFVELAKELFCQMEKPALSTWNAVISGLAQNNCHADVLQLFRDMQQAGFRPNSVTLSAILPTISFFSNLLGGKQVHGYAIRNDWDQNIYVAASLIDAYSKAGLLSWANGVFNSTTARSVILWTSIISAYAAHGDVETAVALFSNMIARGAKPDSVTFTAVLAACAHAGLVDSARQLFSAMSSEYGIDPTSENYACMITVLSRAGMLKEALELISKMPSKPNAKAWGALLNGASVFGDVKIGRLAFDHLVGIEPESTGNYIIMANIYSRARNWGKASEVREKMKIVGLAKLPGCSWIETSSGTQVFVARDTTCLRSAEMYDMLGYLVGMMREEGYVSKNDLNEEMMKYD